jgi:enoyl-CoA hydratase/carnithine racemase
VRSSHAGGGGGKEGALSDEVLVVERHGNVALARLSRPKQLNALDARLQEAILAACAEVKGADLLAGGG